MAHKSFPPCKMFGQHLRGDCALVWKAFPLTGKKSQ